MAILPGGFDEHAAQMRIARFGDRAARLFGATGVFGGDESGEGHQTGRSGKAARVAEFGGDGERGEIVDAAEAAQPFDAGPQGLDGEQVAQFEVDGVQAGDGLVDGADVGAMGVFEGGQRPALGLQPRRCDVWSRRVWWR